MASDEAREIIAAIRGDIETAADALLAAAEKGMRDARAAQEGEAGAYARVEEMLCAVMEACAFQDLVGQRLTKLEGVLAGAPAGDPLLSGPAKPGQGLDQAAADALMNPTPAGPA